MGIVLHQQDSEEDDSSYEEEEDYVCSTLELPSLETDSVSKEIKPAAITQEEFPVFDGGNENFKEELKDKKVEETISDSICTV